MRRRLLVLVVLLLAGCAPTITRPVPAGPVALVQQRSQYDCVIAAVATAARVHYDTASEVAHARGWSESKGGLTLTALRDLAAALAVKTSQTVMWQRAMPRETFVIVQEPSGLLHCIYVKDGLVYDPLYPTPLAWEIAAEDFDPLWIIPILR